jgi:hypothetical protein
MDDALESTEMPVTDPELRQLLGLFDVPAFARRGQDLEYGLGRLRERCRRERSALLEMVRLRLRQWSAVARGPDDWSGAFAGTIASLWPLADAGPPTWADRPATPRRRRAVARDLIASVERFNRRWVRVIEGLDLGPINRLIDQYNRYYVLEKECSLGSPRLAARHFKPRTRLTAETLLADFPPLPVPVPDG